MAKLTIKERRLELEHQLSEHDENICCCGGTMINGIGCRDQPCRSEKEYHITLKLQEEYPENRIDYGCI